MTNGKNTRIVIWVLENPININNRYFFLTYPFLGMYASNDNMDKLKNNGVPLYTSNKVNWILTDDFLFKTSS